MIQHFINSGKIYVLIFVLLVVVVLFPVPSPAGNTGGQSFYATHLSDTSAVYLIPENFAVTPNENGDDSDAIQAAIDIVENRSNFGIVFIPEGRYQISKKIYVWKGIRLIGYGKNRPLFVLEENTPGYQEGDGKYMIHFVSDKPQEGRPIRDANPGTFYSAISNINFEIQKGNPAAVAIRSFFAQHCYIAHVDFYIGEGRAGVDQVGNEIDDCRFFGGDFGIITTKPSPSWPFLMIDTQFENQRQAAISTEEGGLTLVRNQFRNVPAAIVVNPHRAEELFMTDCRFENISSPAVVISDEYNARPQYNFKNLVCKNVPVLAAFRKSGKKINAPSLLYKVTDFCHGLHIHDPGARPEIKTTYRIEPLDEAPAPAPSDIPPLPASENWVNLKSLGAKGDGVTNDTEIIKKAVENYQSIYVPTGRYLVTETITLKANTVLIGLNPITTQIVLADKTPAFCGPGAPVPLLETPTSGENIVTGIGLDTGAFNERAVAAKWMAGTNSYMNDVRFIGCHGTYNADGSRVPVYNEYYNGDPYRDRDWDTQYWSLWITNGGGGTFKDIWTPNSFAQAGICISNTSTPGRIYAMSVEHHVRNEVILKNVSNWKIYDLQMEEESNESPNALPLRIENSTNVTFANLYLYRVIRMISPFPYGVLINSSQNIEFCGIHVYSPTKFSFDNTINDLTHDSQIRDREIARLTISGKVPSEKDRDSESPVIASGAHIEKVVDGFEFIDGATVDRQGNIYFVDSRWHRIYRWSPGSKKLTLLIDAPISPVGLALDQSGNVIVVTKTWDVLTFHPDSNEPDLERLPLVAANSHDGKIAILPGHRWRDEHDFLSITTYSEQKPPDTYSSYNRYYAHHPFFPKDSSPIKNHYIARDGATFIPQCRDLIRAYSLRKAVPGHPFYMADEFGQKTWKFKVNPNGSLAEPELFAENGELDVAVDVKGNVYIPAGHIYVYNKSGKQMDIIEVPERPACVVFGGKDRKTLFIAARSSLYKLEMRYSGSVIN